MHQFDTEACFNCEFNYLTCYARYHVDSQKLEILHIAYQISLFTVKSVQNKIISDKKNETKHHEL